MPALIYTLMCNSSYISLFPTIVTFKSCLKTHLLARFNHTIYQPLTWLLKFIFWLLILRRCMNDRIFNVVITNIFPRELTINAAGAVAGTRYTKQPDKWAGSTTCWSWMVRLTYMKLEAPARDRNAWQLVVGVLSISRRTMAHCERGKRKVCAVNGLQTVEQQKKNWNFAPSPTPTSVEVNKLNEIK